MLLVYHWWCIIIYIDAIQHTTGLLKYLIDIRIIFFIRLHTAVANKEGVTLIWKQASVAAIKYIPCLFRRDHRDSLVVVEPPESNFMHKDDTVPYVIGRQCKCTRRPVVDMSVVSLQRVQNALPLTVECQLTPGDSNGVPYLGQ